MAITYLGALAYVDDYWTNLFFGLDAEQRFIVVIVALGCVTSIVLTLAGVTYYAVNSGHRRRAEAEFKRELLDRGMSADDIVKVIESASPPEDATGRLIASWCKKK